jgi:hypothetical protein
MNEVTCPACAGPDNAECATCNGTSLVSQEVYDTFMAAKAQQEATWQLQRALQELPIENIPGVEQTAIVITTVDNQITAEVDSEQLIWDETTQAWV